MSNILEQIIQLDQQVTLWINNLATSSTDAFWLLLSDNEIWFPAYAIFMLFVLWRLGWKKGGIVVLSLVLTIVLVDQGSNLIKYSAGRLRPCYNNWMIENGLRLPYGLLSTGRFGFFSAHAGNTFGFAFVSSLGLRLNDEKNSYNAYTWSVFIWATLVSLSRIMMGAHFLGDILVGALIGSAVGLLLAFGAHKLVLKVK